MSFATLLINTCTIQVNTPVAFDAYGNPIEAWSNETVDEPCRIMAGVSGGNLNAGREFKVGAEVVQADYMLYLESTATITEQHRVVLGVTTYHVLLVDNRQNGTGVHHKEVWLRTVR